MVGEAGSEAGKWARAQPEGPLLYKEAFGLFLKREEPLKGFLAEKCQDEIWSRMGQWMAETRSEKIIFGIT